MLSAGGAPVAKTVSFSQTVEVAGVTHTLDDEYQWLRGRAWPKLVQDEDIISHLEAENACTVGGTRIHDRPTSLRRALNSSISHSRPAVNRLQGLPREPRRSAGAVLSNHEMANEAD